MKRMLLAVDGSENSGRAADFAGSLSAVLDIPVDVVNVVDDSERVSLQAAQDYQHSEHVSVTRNELLESLGNSIVTEAMARVVGASGHAGDSEVLLGHPAESIVQFADRNGDDCIVMGRRGLGDVRGLLMGSVSNRVSHLTDKVLITTE